MDLAECLQFRGERMRLLPAVRHGACRRRRPGDEFARQGLSRIWGVRESWFDFASLSVGDLLRVCAANSA